MFRGRVDANCERLHPEFEAHPTSRFSKFFELSVYRACSARRLQHRLGCNGQSQISRRAFERAGRTSQGPSRHLFEASYTNCDRPRHAGDHLLVFFTEFPDVFRKTFDELESNRCRRLMRRVERKDFERDLWSEWPGCYPPSGKFTRGKWIADADAEAGRDETAYDFRKRRFHPHHP